MKLLKILGFAFGLSVLVGNTIGMGILRSPGEIAARIDSPFVFILLWVIGACYALLGALCVSELAAMHPLSGGLYPLVHEGLGAFPSFLTGWTDWLGTCGTAGAVAMVLGEYAAPLFGVTGAMIKVIGAIAILMLAFLQWRSVRVGDTVQQVTSLLKALALLALVGAALVMHPHSGGTAPVRPAASAGSTGTFGAVILSLQAIIYTYDGCTGPVYFSEEMAGGPRVIPRTIISGVLLVLLIYLGLNLAFIHVIPLREMAGDPFVAVTVASRLFGATGDLVLRIVMLISLIATVNALLLMASRIPFAMSRDRLFPSVLQRVNRGGTPSVALAVGTGITLAGLFAGALDAALAILTFFFVANYALTFTSLFVLRIRRPEAERPFRVPWYPLVPAVALLGSLAFLIAAVASDLLHSLIALGLVGLSVPGYWVTRRTVSVSPIRIVSPSGVPLVRSAQPSAGHINQE